MSAGKYKEPKAFRSLLDAASRAAKGRPAPVRSMARALGIGTSVFYKYAAGTRVAPDHVIGLLLSIVDGSAELRQIDSERVNLSGPVEARYELVTKG